MNIRMSTPWQVPQLTTVQRARPARRRFPRLRLRPGILILVSICAVLLAASARAADLPVQDGLLVWLKADAVNTADANQVRVSGSDLFVKSWLDQSGNSHAASNATDND